MENLINIENYNSGMHKSLEDKLWFCKFLDIPALNSNTVIIDYGCADGELLKTLSKKYPGIEMIGLDINEDMIKLAEENCKDFPNISFMSNINEFKKGDRSLILIMSSVFHEIISYYRQDVFEADLYLLNPEYIFFRDIMFSESVLRYPLKEDIDKVKNHPRFQELSKNKEVDQYLLLEFFMKYRFLEWEKEKDEEYSPYLIQEIPKAFPNYNIIYQKHYILPFLKFKIKEDFDIELRDNTHVNIIFKRYEKEN